MKNKKILIFIITNLFIISSVGISAYENTIEDEKKLTDTPISLKTNGYGIQWEKNYGNNPGKEHDMKAHNPLVIVMEMEIMNS